MLDAKPTVRLELDQAGECGLWKRCLPEGSRATESFRKPIRLVVDGGTSVRPLPEHPARPMKVYTGHEPMCEYTQDRLDTFGSLLPQVLQCITRLTHHCTTLVFFSGPATHEEMFGMWPFLPFGPRDDMRFYVSAVSRDSRTAPLPRVWLSLEYAYEPFRRLLGPDGFEYSYGMTIMGMSVSEGCVKEYLTRDPRDEGLLEKSLTSDALRCWWVCEADFDGMTVWHKDYAGDELGKHFESAIQVG